jgi:tetratricopeptide (TPR) repeat protein
LEYLLWPFAKDRSCPVRLLLSRIKRLESQVKQISAFVGHSFTLEDSAPVEIVLKYLSELSGMLPGFSWDHAERAEPKLIDEKVLRLIREKNLFIGICTKKERVGPGGVFTRSKFPLSQKLVAPESEVEWKTSDWVIQEIGLAIGLSMDVILLVEDGVRAPGGLQGSLEYIPFDRAAPERSFTKLLQMIRALSPRSRPDEGQVSETPVSPPPIEGQAQVEGKWEWVDPKPDWLLRDYKFAAMHFIAINSTDDLGRITTAYLQSELAQSPKEKLEWEAFLEYQQLSWEKGGNLARLIGLSEEASDSDVVSGYLGALYKKRNEPEKAAVAFSTAAQRATSVEKEIEFLGDAACALQAAGNVQAALDCIKKLKQRSAEAKKGVLIVLNQEKRFSELRKELDYALGATECLSDLDPADNDSMFSLGYSYSERGDKELAAFHYGRIPRDKRSSGTWNNLALEQDKLGMPSRCVDSLREAIELGETLASSNLANKLISAGFLAEAMAICESAMKLDSYHKNVIAAIGRIKDAPESESDLEKEAFDKARPLSAFYRKFGEALVDVIEFTASKWISPKCQLVASIEGEVVRIEGEYVQRTAGIASALFGLSGTSGDDEVCINLVYEGQIRGRAIVARVTRDKQGKKVHRSSLISDTAADTALLILSANMQIIDVLERKMDGSFKTYSLNRA